MRRMLILLALAVCFLLFLRCSERDEGGLYRLRSLASRSATMENPAAQAGRGGMSGNGLKASPAIKLFKAGAVATLLDQKGPGMIRHIWCTVSSIEPRVLRNLILRMYWETETIPAVEVPLPDFFGVAHGAVAPMYSDLVSAQTGRGYNCFIPMPFADKARITIANESDEDLDWFFYQIDFTLGDKVTDEDGRFHASFNRKNPTVYGRDFVILEVANARGMYLGCVLGVRPLSPGWWGEGEVKMYIDGDEAFPTICGTGLEDYIGAAWGLVEHSTPTQGAPLVRPSFTSLYRFHIHDPVYFQKNIKVTVQQMGNGKKSLLQPVYGDTLIFGYKNHPRRSPDDIYYLRSDDVSCVAFWYQYPVNHRRMALPPKEVRSANLFKEQAEPAKD